MIPLCLTNLVDLSSYVDLAVTCEEYDLLKGLNQITLAKYNDMVKLAGGLTEVSSKLNEKCE